MDTQTPELAVAIDAARAAGELVAKCFHQGIESRPKRSDPQATFDLVTDADLKAEFLIADVIRRAYPAHAILGEELHPSTIAAEHLWIVDPIDGTNNFAHRIAHFAISIGYYRAGRAECGVIYNPVHEEWYVAARGQGAWFNQRRVQVAPPETRLDQVLIGMGFYYDRGAMMEATLAAIRDLFQLNIHGIRRFGTASLDLAYVATGRFGAYFEYELSPWDFAAARLFVEEAGGLVTTCTGAPLPLAKTHLLASNGPLHPAVLEVVRRYWPPTASPRLVPGSSFPSSAWERK
jgi:myo-inositol-1(or 4)-monophosphatase